MLTGPVIALVAGGVQLVVSPKASSADKVSIPVRIAWFPA